MNPLPVNDGMCPFLSLRLHCRNVSHSCFPYSAYFLCGQVTFLLWLHCRVLASLFFQTLSSVEEESIGLVSGLLHDPELRSF